MVVGSPSCLDNISSSTSSSSSSLGDEVYELRFNEGGMGDSNMYLHEMYLQGELATAYLSPLS